MLKMRLLQIHRWVALILSVPLAVLILTGVVLAVEPIVIGLDEPPSLITADTLGTVLAKHDPQGKARALVVRAYAGTVSLGGGRDNMINVDLASNERVDSPGLLADIFSTARRLHEHLIDGFGWLVTVSTIAMILLIAIGVVMGWPRLSNTLSGWHKGTGWFLLPLLILSPLTGLFMVFGVTFAAPPQAPAGGPPVTLAEAVRIVGANHDLADVSWIRPRGGVMLARLDDDGEMRAFAVGHDGLTPTARNWPRLIHEGNWAGTFPALINLVVASALALLLGTGLWIWGRRKFRRRPARA
jgi:uncharacterized iron-regulated membrane protein